MLLVHYDDLVTDLDGQMRRIADWLNINVPDDVWPTLVQAATFTAMRQRADVLAPNPVGVLKDDRAFFRQGRSGTGPDLLTPDELARYHERVAQIVPPDLLTWLHQRS